MTEEINKITDTLDLDGFNDEEIRQIRGWIKRDLMNNKKEKIT